MVEKCFLIKDGELQGTETGKITSSVEKNVEAVFVLCSLTLGFRYSAFRTINRFSTSYRLKLQLDITYYIAGLVNLVTGTRRCCVTGGSVHVLHYLRLFSIQSLLQSFSFQTVFSSLLKLTADNLLFSTRWIMPSVTSGTYSV